MTLAPDTPFSHFAEKVTAKFSKNFEDSIIKFKNKRGDQTITRDDSDYEHWQPSRLHGKGAEARLKAYWKSGTRIVSDK